MNAVLQRGPGLGRARSCCGARRQGTSALPCIATYTTPAGNQLERPLGEIKTLSSSQQELFHLRSSFIAGNDLMGVGVPASSPGGSSG